MGAFSLAQLRLPRYKLKQNIVVLPARTAALSRSNESFSVAHCGGALTVKLEGMRSTLVLLSKCQEAEEAKMLFGCLPRASDLTEHIPNARQKPGVGSR